MLHLLHLLTLYSNEHALSRYIRFIQSRPNTRGKGKHRHHILPKAIDFFPEFRDFAIHRWNLVYLTPREHHIAHRMLHRAFPGSTQTFAFYNMSNEQKRMRSRDYDTSRLAHIERLAISNRCPIRCSKISKALSGKPKSLAHRQSMMNHVVTEDTRAKLREWNTGKVMSEESCRKMSVSRTGKKRGAHSDLGKENIAKSKMSFRIKTPIGIFESFIHFHTTTGIEIKTIKNIFRDLDKLPRSKNLKIFSIESSNCTWRELGFDRLDIS